MDGVRGFVHWINGVTNDAVEVNHRVEGEQASDTRPPVAGLAPFERLPFAARAFGMSVAVLAAGVAVVALMNFILGFIRGFGGTAERAHDTGVFFAEGLANAVLAAFLLFASIGIFNVRRWGWWLGLLVPLATAGYDAFRLSQSPPFGLSKVYPSPWPAAGAWATLILAAVAFVLALAVSRFFREPRARAAATDFKRP